MTVNYHSANNWPDDERVQAHQCIADFLSQSGLDVLSKKDRVEFLKSLSFPEFRLLMTRINGVLRGMPIEKQGNDYTVGLRIFDPDDPDGISIDYEPPEHKLELLEKFFIEMQGSISEENLDNFAVKMRYAIVFAHIFSDANGRTSRYMQQLLSGGNVDMSAAVKESNKTLGPCEANRRAIPELFKDQLPGSYNILMPKYPNDVLQFCCLVSSMMVDYGYGGALKSLALIKTFPEIDAELMFSDPKIYRSKKNKDDKKYNEIYVGLQDMLFWKVQELLDKELDGDGVENVFQKQFKKRVVGLI